MTLAATTRAPAPIAAEAATEGCNVVAGATTPSGLDRSSCQGPSASRIVASRDDSPAYGTNAPRAESCETATVTAPPSLGAGSLGIAFRVAALGLATVLGFVLARWLGPAELGRYETAMGWSALLAVLIVAGTDRLLVRETAAGIARGDHARVHGVRAWSALRHRNGTFLAIGAAGVAAAFAGDTSSASLVVFGAILAAGTAGTRRRAAILQGHGRVGASQFVELVLVPGLALVAIAGVMLAGAGSRQAAAALACQAFAAVTASFVARAWLVRNESDDRVHATADGEPGAWRAASFALLAMGVLSVLQGKADIVLCAALTGDAELGRLGVATRIGNLVAVPLLVANAVIAPQLARAHAQGDTAGLARIAVGSARAATGFAAVLAAGALLFADPLLALFGSGYGEARSALFAVVVAQFVNVAMGSVGLALLMTGHERSALVGLIAGALVDLSGIVWLVPQYGAFGAALARGAGLVVWNVLLAVAVRRRLGVALEAWAVIR